MIQCPACGASGVRAHATLKHVSWGRRFWTWDPILPIAKIIAVELSCGTCYHAFVSWPDGSTNPAPNQAAHDALIAAQRAVIGGSGGTGQTSEQDARPSRPQARPAPDPRSRKR